MKTLAIRRFALLNLNRCIDDFAASVEEEIDSRSRLESQLSIVQKALAKRTRSGDNTVLTISDKQYHRELLFSRLLK